MASNRSDKHRRQADIVIAGGGAVAAATTLAAAARGLHVRHVAAAAGGGGRHYALSRRSVAFLQALGVQVALLPVERYLLYAKNRSLSLADDGKPLCYMVGEEALLAALSTRQREMGVAATSCSDIRWQKTDAHAVQLTVDGTLLTASLLAVADGARSPLAAQLGIYGSITDFKQHAVVAQVVAPTLPADCAMQWFGDNDIVALLPMGGGVFSLVWSTAAPPQAADTEAALKKRIEMTALTIAPDSIRAFPLRAVTRALRCAPRCALLGDAAGVIHPLAGQGLNLGLADADTLLQCVHRRLYGNIALGLAAYSQARSRRHAQLRQFTEFLLPQAQRASLLLQLAKLPPLRRAAVAFANA